MNRRESGYSLVEILVVVAMIGVISLVTIPNFIAMRHSGKLKNSMRNFVADVRAMRQRAVTRHRQTKVSFTTGTAATGREYFLSEFDPATATWNQIGARKQLEESCYFVSSTLFTDVDSDGTIDVVFRSDGTSTIPPGPLPPTIVVKTDWRLSKSSGQSVAGQYTVAVEYSGFVKTS